MNKRMQTKQIPKVLEENCKIRQFEFGDVLGLRNSFIGPETGVSPIKIWNS